MSERDEIIMLILVALALLVIGWSHQSQLYDLQRRMGRFESERR